MYAPSTTTASTTTSPTDAIQRSGHICECLAQTSKVIQAFSDSISSPTSSQVFMSVDDVLCKGSALVDHWESLHACPDAETHLDAPLLQAMINAAVQMTALYEAAVECMLGNGGDEARDQQPHGGAGSRDTRSNGTAVQDQPAFVVTKVSARLGSMLLDEEQTEVVARVALRHETMRLGQMLHDIEEDMSTMRERDASAEAGHLDGDVRKVRQTTDLLLRILGRINCQ
ncbi:uncharacterized protein DSM5745_06736 [Aspergillus mulundensis]|uniref:Uncharacterized protein n=1 Tax=Aspergillus mulundensis TaxID=1810919 RepID=A0A3D8RS98_9EURO|nr:hypothetical protein DSM5745_06736 [Aspergillus mulundensis]RDW76744.1 hypothetical protein DSM5745_06736 [Aspergillus mulundensis]